MKLFLKIFLCILLIYPSEESHFRGGSITAQPQNFTSSTVTLEMTMTLAWRLSFSSSFYCDQSVINANGLTGPSSDTLTCSKIGTSSCSQVLATCNTYCIAFSPTTGGDDWTYGRKTFFVTVPQVQYYEAIYASTAWMALNGGGNQGNWEVRVRLDTRIRNDTGRINSSPLVTISPIVTFRKGIVSSIPIVTADADNDIIRCRWADSSLNECGGVCQNNPSPASNQFGTSMTKAVPPATLNETTCIITFDGTLASAISPGYYAVAVQIEDFKTTSDTIPLSSVPLQFLIQLVTVNSNCFTPPAFIGDKNSSGTYYATTGQPFTDRMISQVNCLNESIRSIQVLGVSGVNLSSLAQFPSTANQWFVSLIWIPKSTQKGPNVICATATDSAYQITIHCYTVIVRDLTTTTSTTTTTTTSTSTTTTTTTTQQQLSTTQSSLGAIIGGSVGGVIGVGAVAAAAYFIISKFMLSSAVTPPPAPISQIPSQPPKIQKPPKPVKTRMQAANIQNKTFNMKKIPQVNNLTNIEQVAPITPKKEPLPPPKTRMMGPLIKHKTFNLPLDI